MHLTTLVDILRSEIPGLGERVSTRSNLARLYAERGCYEAAAAEMRPARRAPPRPATAHETAAGDDAVANVSSLVLSGRLEDAEREVERILAADDVPWSVSTKLQRILARARRAAL